MELTVADVTLCIEDERINGDVRQKINAYMCGERVVFGEEIDLSDLTKFQQRVLGEIRRVGYGEMVTYSELAEFVRSQSSPEEMTRSSANGLPVRAAASACGANPVPIVIPCHRVVAKQGIGGYRFGRDVKEALLELER